MDPLSALAVAAALKDLVEFARSLNDSFQKIWRNQERNARLSSSTFETLNKLKDFCEKNPEAFVVSNLRNEIENWRKEMQSIYDKTQEFVSIPSMGGLKRVIPILKAYKKRNRMEEDINKLEKRISTSSDMFFGFIGLQTNINTLRILESTTLFGATQGRCLALTTASELKVSVQLDASRIGGDSRHMHQLTGEFGITKESRSPLVTKSATMAEASLLSNASKHAIADMYLRSNIAEINQLLPNFRRSQMFPIAEPIAYFTSPFNSVIWFRSFAVDHPSCHKSAVASSLIISDVLARHHVSLSMQKGVIEMFELSDKLGDLGMIPEALIVCQWTVDLLRTMLDNGPLVYQPFLCMALENLAGYQEEVGNLSEASNTIAACLNQSRELPGLFSNHEMQDQLASALIVSSRLARKGGDTTKALANAAEAMSIYEEMFKEVSTFGGLDPSSLPSEKFNTRKGDKESYSLLTTARVENDGVEVRNNHSTDYSSTLAEANLALVNYSSESTSGLKVTIKNIKAYLQGAHKYVFHYGRALQEHSDIQYALRRYKESSESGIRSLNIVRQLDSFYHHNFQQHLAEAYYELAWPAFQVYIPAEDALTYAKRAVDIYLDLSRLSRSYRASCCNAMRAYARLLKGVKRYDEALEVSREFSKMAKEIIDDQELLADSFREISANLRLLGREDEAIIARNQAVTTYRVALKAASRHEGESHLKLGEYLRRSGWYQEAVVEFREAEVYYRYLVIDHGVEEIKGLANALTSLASCLYDLKDYDQALDEGGKALDFLEPFVNEEPAIPPLLIRALNINLDVACQSDDEPKSMERIRYCLEQFDRLFGLYPEQVRDSMPGAFEKYREKLDKHHNTQGLMNWGEAAFKWYEAQSIPGTPIIESGRLDAYVTFTSNLMDLGRARRALEVITRAIEIGKHQGCVEGAVCYTNFAFILRTQILVSLGQPAEALKSNLEAIDYAKQNSRPDECDGLGFLHLINSVVPTTRIGRYGDALKAAEEVVRISRLADDPDIPEHLCGLADRLADTQQMEKALDCAREAYNLVLEYPATRTHTPPWSYPDPDILHVHFVFAVQLLSSGDCEEAARHLESDLVASLKERTTLMPGRYYPDYASTLRVLGWCYCALGQHDKGIQSSVELSRLRKRLELNPEISELVDVELAADIKRPSHLALWEKIDLQCGHHHWDGEEAEER